LAAVRICLVSHEYPPETAHGGIGTQTWNKAHALVALGHDVEVLSCAGKRYDQPIVSQRESEITVHRMQPPGEGARDHLPVNDQSVYMLGYTWKIAVALRSVLARGGIELVNFPEYGAEGYAFQLNRCEHNWIPVIVQLHGPLAMFIERVGWPEKDSPFGRAGAFMEGESIRMADWLMASSANIADFTSEYYQVPRESIDVVHCGIDCDLFRPLEKVQRDSHRPTVLFVGNVTASKGIKTVFEAVMRLRMQHPDILLQVLGKGDDAWNKIESQARKAGAFGNIQRLSFIRNRDEIVHVYQQADVVASPADHEVGVANVYVEAMACGCPVVASTTGGAPEAVDNGETGFLVPPRDVDAVTSALDKILRDKELRCRMAVAARNRVLNYFAREKYIRRVLAAYGKAIERSQERLHQLKSQSA
jgi:glycosyltransferase involved in cell wall biosynthesis